MSNNQYNRSLTLYPKQQNQANYYNQTFQHQNIIQPPQQASLQRYNQTFQLQNNIQHQVQARLNYFNHNFQHQNNILPQTQPQQDCFQNQNNLQQQFIYKKDQKQIQTYIIDNEQQKKTKKYQDINISKVEEKNYENQLLNSQNEKLIIEQALIIQQKQQQQQQEKENNIQQLKNQNENLKSELVQNNNVVKDIKNRIQELEKQINEKDEQYQNVGLQNRDLNVQYLEINQKFKLLQNKLKEAENNIQKKDEDYKIINSQYNNLKIQYKKNDEELYNLQNKYQEIEKQNLDQQQQIEKLKTQQSILEKQNFEYAQQLKEEQGEQNYTSQAFEQVYDLEIKIPSILHLENNIEYSSQIIEKKDIKNTNQKLISVIQNNQILFDQNQNVIGLLGQRNKGKTFMLKSLINQSPLLTFNNQKSQGISIKYFNNNGRRVVFIDHAGYNQPTFIDYDNNPSYINYIKKKNKGEDYFKDYQNFQNEIILQSKFQKITELMQQGFIIQQSQILILVVSNINQEEWNYIYSISNSVGKDPSQNLKKMFVVHNLKHINQPESVKKYIQEIKNIYPLRQQQIIYFEQPLYKQNSIFIDNMNQNVNHLFIAKEKSQAGEEYNKFAIDYLKEEIAHCKQQIKFDLIQKFMVYLNQNIKSYLTLKCYEQNQDLKDNDFVEYDEQNRVIQLKREYHIEKINYLQMNLGIIQNQCQYSLVSNELNNKLYLLVQIPNSAKFNYKFIKREGLFQIMIFQNHEIEQQLGGLYISNRKLEEQYQIKICKEKELYKLIKDECKDFQNGIHQFVFTQEFDIEDF
ncbi:hypothetical protein ABPG74_006970 [Tetrahymena malaccensis]